MQTLVLLGGNILNSGFSDVANRHEWALQVVDWHGPRSADWLDAGAVMPLDIKSPELPAQLAAIPLAFCYSSADVAAENVARINQQAGLGAPDLEAVRNCVHKDRAYACFARDGLLKRPYVCVTKEEAADRVALVMRMEAYLAQEQHLVVKPTSSSSSRGVTFLDHPTAEQLATLVTELAQAFDSSVLVDQYIPGDEYSIEMVVDGAGNVMVWPIGFKGKSIHQTSEAVSVKVIYNPVIDAALKERMVHQAIGCAKATGLRYSLVHLEMKLAPWGELYPMEIASRSSGFVASHLCDVAAQRSYLDTYYRVLKGELLDSYYAGESAFSSVYFFYDPPAGRVIEAMRADALPFPATSFEVLHANPLLLSEGATLDAHKNDETKKNFLVIKTLRREALHEELIACERAFYARHIAAEAVAA